MSRYSRRSPSLLPSRRSPRPCQAHFFMGRSHTDLDGRRFFVRAYRSPPVQWHSSSTRSSYSRPPYSYISLPNHSNVSCCDHCYQWPVETRIENHSSDRGGNTVTTSSSTRPPIVHVIPPPPRSRAVIKALDASDDDGGSSSYYADEESGEGGYSSDYNDTTLSDESTLDQTHDTQEAKNDEGDEQQSSSVQNRRKRSLSEYEDEVKWYPEIERKSESESDIHNSASEKANREKKVHRDLHMSTTAPVTSESPATKQETTGAITAFITKGRADKVLYAVYSDALEAIQEVTSRKNITELKVSLVVEIANVDGGEEMVVLKETLIF